MAIFTVTSIGEPDVARLTFEISPRPCDEGEVRFFRADSNTVATNETGAGRDADTIGPAATVRHLGQLDGSVGPGQICGLAVNDVLRGYEGNDSLSGRPDSGTLNGVSGGDTSTGGPSDADLRDNGCAGDGSDTVDKGRGNDLIFGPVGNATIAGDTRFDELQMAFVICKPTARSSGPWSMAAGSMRSTSRSAVTRLICWFEVTRPECRQYSTWVVTRFLRPLRMAPLPLTLVSFWSRPSMEFGPISFESALRKVNHGTVCRTCF